MSEWTPTPHIRWWTDNHHKPPVLQQAWQHEETGRMVWRPVLVEMENTDQIPDIATAE